jgi:Flp pilus assembly protein TadG
MTRRFLNGDTRGSTTVEFAFVGLLLCLITFGAVETGLLWWLKSGLQLTASMTARCGAIGYTYNTSSFPCTSTSTTQSYAVTTSQKWLMPNMLTTANVTVNGKVTSCNGFSGDFFSVSLASNYFASLPPPLGNLATISVTACFPMQ